MTQGTHNKRKLFFFDIDGTLYTSDKRLQDSTKKALQALEAAGHVVGIATGRSYFLAEPVIQELALSTYVLLNGAIGVFNGQTVLDDTLDAPELARVVALAEQHQHQVVYQQAIPMFRQRAHWEPEDLAAFEGVGGHAATYYPNFSENHPVYQALIFCTPEEEALYHQLALSQLRLVRWHRCALDVVRANGSKAAAIVALAERHGFAIEDVVAFGDGNNDVEMIAAVGFGVAMGNAVPAVKEVAQYVAADCDRDGIAQALVALGYINAADAAI